MRAHGAERLRYHWFTAIALRIRPLAPGLVLATLELHNAERFGRRTVVSDERPTHADSSARTRPMCTTPSHQPLIMRITAHVSNHEGHHTVRLETNGAAHTIEIPPKPSGFGSRANGGELLALALATCYCNDLYREAAKRGLDLTHVEVTVEGEFGAEGEPARALRYAARVTSGAPPAEVRALMEHTDRVAEIQNTVRSGLAVTLASVEVVAPNS